jgi:ribose transport system ATP-binding protein
VTVGSPGRPAATYALRAEGIHKRFGPTVALSGVDLHLRPGQIHALLGGNGSGKSTLIRVLAGVEPGDSGTVAVSGRSFDCRNLTPADAEECGMRFIHQQGSTFSSLTVTENMCAGIGFPQKRIGGIDWKAAHRHTRELIDRHQIAASPSDEMAHLRAVAQQQVAIARALQGREEVHEGVLVLDEPTASLPAEEVHSLHSALRRYAQLGQSVLYVTHRLEELPGFVDRATVLRDGEVAGELDGAEVEHERLVELMSGSALLSSMKGMRHLDRKGAEGEVARLAISGLAGGPLRSATLSVSPGEIVGLAGLVGSGRSSLLEMVFGVQPWEAGTVEIDGEALVPDGKPPAEVAYVPEQRIEDASFLPLTLAENLMAASTTSHFRAGRVHHREETAQAKALVAEYGIRASSVQAPFNSLSGGNQQKAVLARWLMKQPRLLLLDEPTQGVDVAARAAIHQTIREAVGSGAAALFASSDAEELAALCDRVVVLVDGESVAEIRGDDLTPERVDHLSYGERDADG